MQYLIPAITIKAALAGFKALGLDTAVLRSSIGLSPKVLTDPFAAVPNDLFAKLWLAAYQQNADPMLPTQAGFAVPFSEFGLLDHLVQTAVTIGEGFHILNLYLWLVSINLSLRFTHSDGDWVWVENHPPETSRFISEQWTLAILCQRFRAQMAGFEITAVHLTQAAGDADRFSAQWNVPVRLGQPSTGFKLAEGVWNRANEVADPQLNQTLRTVAEQVVIKQVEEAPLVYAIRTRLPQALAEGSFSAEDIAAELGLSKRTLQRRLSAERMTFQELLDVYRQEQAMLMLQKGERDMGQIAYSLGYNEQSSFNRAFRRWTGQSPSAWLK